MKDREEIMNEHKEHFLRNKEFYAGMTMLLATLLIGIVLGLSICKQVF